MEENTGKSIELEAYDTTKVNGIKKLLEFQMGKGIPFYFKIAIDKNDIVPRTNDVKQFDNYIGLLGSGKKLTISIFNSATATHISSKRVFDLSNILPEQVFTPVPQTLNGIETKEQWKAEAEKDYTARDTARKLKETEERLAEAEEFIEMQTTENTALKAEILKLKSEGGSFKDVLLTGIQALTANNPKLLEKIPGVAALAGLNDSKVDNKEEAASFTKSSPAFETSEDEKTYIHALRRMEQDDFEEWQVQLLVKIIDQLARKKEDIKPVAELLNIKKS